MSIVALDFGGTAIKHGVWNDEKLLNIAKITLPKTWEDALTAIEQILMDVNKNYHIEGIAISVPGAVSQMEDRIYGVTAIPYIHHRNFTADVSKRFGLPVTMENDANCAALSEVWKGNAADAENILFFVFGTGVGGAIIQNKKVLSGRHQFGGEFGYMMLNEEGTFSELASIVRYVDFYNRRTGAGIEGEELFALAKAEDILAKNCIQRLCHYSALGIYNMMVGMDPDVILIGGAISENQYFIEGIKAELNILRERNGAQVLDPVIIPSKFRNNANLIGAVYNYKKYY